MSVWAILRVKDEFDILPAVITRLRRQVDNILAEDNGSTDGTREWLLAQPDLHVQDDPEVAYYQSAAMSRLAEQARQRGATWILPVDADEVWCADQRIKHLLAELPAEVLVAEAYLYDHVATGLDPKDGDAVDRIPWRRQPPAPLRKVAFRALKGAVVHQGNHGVTVPGYRYPPAVTCLSVHHFPYRSVEQFCSKARNGAAAYAASDLPEEMGAHWRGYGRILEESGRDGIAEVFHTWFYREDPRVPINLYGERQGPLVHDPR